MLGNARPTLASEIECAGRGLGSCKTGMGNLAVGVALASMTAVQATNFKEEALTHVDAC